jgi:hypothetical protein
MKYTLIAEDKWGGSKITREFEGDFLPDVLSELELFLKGAGFVFNGNLDFVDDFAEPEYNEEWEPEEQWTTPEWDTPLYDEQDLPKNKSQHFFDTEMNPETARYVFRIMALKLIMEHPADYGYQIPNTARYSPIKCKVIHVKNPINNIAMWARQHGTSLKNIRI